MAYSFCTDDPESGYLSERLPAPRSGGSSFWMPDDSKRERLNVLRGKARLAVVIGKLWALKAIALELFDSVSLECEVDPEFANSQYLVFNVSAAGEVKEISARRCEWHRRTHALLGDKADLVKLIIDIS